MTMNLSFLRVNKNLIIICFLALSADMIGTIIATTQSLFAINLGASISFIGLIAAFSSLASIFFSIPLGIISDRIGRKNVISIGFILRICGTSIFYLAKNLNHLLLAVIFLNIGALASFMNFQAYLADIYKKPKLGRVIALQTTSSGIGVTIGPLIGGFASSLWGYKNSYLIAFFLGIISIFIVFFNLDKVKHFPSGEFSKNINYFSRISSILNDPNILWLAVMNTINTIMAMVILVYFPVLGSDLGYTIELIGFLLFLRGISTTIIRIPVGLTIIKIGEPLLMISANALGIFGLLTLSLIDNYIIVIMMLMLIGSTYGAYLTSSKTLVFLFSSPSEKGIMLGVVRIFEGILCTISAFIIGMIAQEFGIKNGFLLVASTLFIILSIMIFFGYKKGIYKKNN